jgi:hypothetical protein
MVINAFEYPILVHSNALQQVVIPAMAAAAHDATNARVMIRLRPPAEKFKASSMFTIDANEPGIIGLKGSGASDPEREFVFDSVFDENAGNSAVFEQCCRGNLEAVVLRGLSSSVICYGPTGSGKQHTAIGDLSDESKMGVMPRALKQLFHLIAARPDLKFSVHMSAVELYCDAVFDLLKDRKDPDAASQKGSTKGDVSARSHVSAKSTKSAKSQKADDGELDLVERADGRTVVKDAAQEEIRTPDDGIHLLNRIVGRTNPSRSSRAHTIFSVVVTQSHKSGTEENKVGTFYCCRLGGCEKVSLASNDQEQRQKEDIFVQRSLVALGNVMSALGRGEQAFVPYKESKLTRMLQDALSSGPRVSLITCVHPLPASHTDCTNALLFSNRCRNIKAPPKVNLTDTDPENQARVIRKLLVECASLKEQLTAAHEHYQRKLTDVSHTAHSMPSSSSAPPSESKAADSSSDTAAAAAQQQQQQQAAMALAAAAAPVPGGGNAQVAEMTRQVKELKDKLTKRNSDVRELKESTKATEDKLRSDLDTYRKKLAARDEEIKRLQLQAKEDAMALTQKSSAEIAALTENNGKLVAQMMATVNAIPIELKGKSDAARDVQAAVQQSKEAITKIYEARFKELNESKVKALDVQKTQYEFWLDKKIQEFKAYVTQQTELQQQKDAQIAELEKQVMALFNFGQKLTTIISNHEHGMYPVYEKSGIRTVQIPSSHKPGALGDDVMRNIRSIMQRANSFLDTHDVNATGTNANVETAAFDHDASADPEGAADVEALKKELQELRSISQASQVICVWLLHFFGHGLTVSVSGEERDGARADRRRGAQRPGRPSNRRVHQTIGRRAHVRAFFAVLQLVCIECNLSFCIESLNAIYRPVHDTRWPQVLQIAITARGANHQGTAGATREQGPRAPALYHDCSFGSPIVCHRAAVSRCSCALADGSVIFFTATSLKHGLQP